jgi:hypothetical protein
MPPRKSEEVPVAIRKKVVEAYKIEKSYAELARLCGITRTQSAILFLKINLIKVFYINIDPHGGQSSLCATKSNFQG